MCSTLIWETCPSWAEIVGWWVELLQAGATRWHAPTHTWITDKDLVPESLLGNPVAYDVTTERDPRFSSRSPY